MRFCLNRGDGRIRVYRRRNERYTEACTLERDRFGGAGPVMVFGGVSQHHRTELVVIVGNLNAVRYKKDILLPHVVPFLQVHPDMTLQHDNATSHTARSVSDFLQDRNVSVLPWPSKSPDLNPNEHVWDLLDRRVRARAIPPPEVPGNFAGPLVEELDNISQLPPVSASSIYAAVVYVSGGWGQLVISGVLLSYSVSCVNLSVRSLILSFSLSFSLSEDLSPRTMPKDYLT
uniref:Tc1-like transposase DDE domain-containing protein n=1 Tax=Oncorhynchus tshawytscha TaxID=74940 RepID=A0AAZ3PR33_ONCTS